MTSNMEAGMWAACGSETYEPRAELAEWYKELDGLGAEATTGGAWEQNETVTSEQFDALAGVLGWKTEERFDCNSVGGEIAVFALGANVVVCYLLGTEVPPQIIPADEWREWQARCPEWDDVDEDD